MTTFWHHFTLCAPLFLMVFLGWAMVKIKLFDTTVTKALSKFVFKFLMPVMLFDLLSKTRDMPPIDLRVLLAFFGSCVVVYVLGSFLGAKLFRQDSTGRVITGMGGIFGNNVQLGVPIVQTGLGTAAMPTISLIIIFNVLLLWTSATACVEFGKTGGKIDGKMFLHAMGNIFKNPIVLGIICGSIWALSGLELPKLIGDCTHLVSTATTPCALIVVGMGLAQHSFTAALLRSSVVTVLKLVVQPLGVYVFCKLLGVPEIETNAATLLACLPVAINLYIMAAQFESQEDEASSAIFVSTFVSAVTVPLTLTLLGVEI